MYYAHSAENLPYDRWQTLYSHAAAVGDLAASFASVFGTPEFGRCAGLLHDIGKYTLEFHARLHGKAGKVDHTTAGAKIAVERWGRVGKLLAFCIAGHHAGLANGAGEGDGRRTLQQRLAVPFGEGRNDLPVLDEVWRSEISLPDQLPSPPLKASKEHPFFSYAFFARMLYSCLVDADYLDTEAFYLRLENRNAERDSGPTLNQLHERYFAYLSDFRRTAASALQTTPEQQRNAELNRVRSHILDYATEQAVQEPGLFTLTVPTGGGKTYTSMAFALEHAKRHGLRRVIYVIPFTSIIEQNAAVFRKAFGDMGERAVLEHHSSFDDTQLRDNVTKDKLRLASENWNAPVVVTTSVQFFESLFSDRSSRCRKLHNIAGSVIILDEAQMLPLELLLPIMQAIKELATNYRCSVVMCTATQPAIHAKHGFYRGFQSVRELAPDPQGLFDTLRRTTVRHIGEQTDAQLFEKLQAHDQALIIVNNRRHARSLYDNAKHLDGVFHLTTLMCAKHRSQVLDTVHERLRQGLACRVVATSLIEAGVDVDFPFVMRAEAGLDSVAQAAGRCNREGKRPVEYSKVEIFRPQSTWKPPAQLGALASAMRSVERQFATDLLSTEAITSYFTLVYELKGADLDHEHILAMHHRAGPSLDIPFQTIAQKVRLIESVMVPVIVPLDENAKELIATLRSADKVGSILRKLQPYTVQVPRKALDTLRAAGRVELLNEYVFRDQFYCLIGLDLYDESAGLHWENPLFIELESLVY